MRRKHTSTASVEEWVPAVLDGSDGMAEVEIVVGNRAIHSLAGKRLPMIDDR
jgi:hypothetical protein